MSIWNPKDFCKEGYYGINNKDIAVCGKENYQNPCLKKECELYQLTEKAKIASRKQKSITELLK
ncbi:hypothetical protein LCGC14_0495330 [marine sediment metagenome]|uniref:Uncharacterized protein n=1 Tax=marine sediment metagenome TaxID=412755 RepID=A0A0F9USG0_9ZZZZ|nr:hypothetical protein [bacterium]